MREGEERGDGERVEGEAYRKGEERNGSKEGAWGATVRNEPGGRQGYL